ncbi:hypothetical protein BofuT4_P073480.1 [Botrytis cinerea T4]|uniref:histone acetyltransferase n=1 Tax=Botryotinia fuckeliana (strain T4) TaxID=999810 RepID=G2XPD0_BOTF4|nr:hypothetical protein BofuT4_P073480.1 [Botrytis cinerea T4]
MAKHRECCERKGRVPGNCVYEHDENGEWSVWEVDGEVEGSLSLFAKLFLDNKSVLYDVQSFNYFLLVHTNPSTKEQQIVGFFSKEKMSWDNNNLACILVFPPWQKKGLGSILIGTSYEISRREGLLGGPEKPISELGKKGYGRFWGAEVARWLLECEVGVDTLMGEEEVEEEEEELDVEVIKVEKKPPAKKPSGKGMGKGWRKAEGNPSTSTQINTKSNKISAKVARNTTYGRYLRSNYCGSY